VPWRVLECFEFGEVIRGEAIMFPFAICGSGTGSFGVNEIAEVPNHESVVSSQHTCLNNNLLPANTVAIRTSVVISKYPLKESLLDQSKADIFSNGLRNGKR
jgi:hypothetical protein